jgi:hypothetical protein
MGGLSGQAFTSPETGRSQNVGGHCFAVPLRHMAIPCAVALPATSARALASLLPMLGCGEEAAALGFDRLAESSELKRFAHKALHAIAEEERVHNAMLEGLRSALPIVPQNPAIRRAARRFHHSLQADSAALNLARIAGIDAAVCVILSRLLSKVSPISRDTGCANILRQIRQDEARHVAVSRTIAAGALTGPDARDAAAQAREGLADLLCLNADAFERLCVNPEILCRDVRSLPNGLFAA